MAQFFNSHPLHACLPADPILPADHSLWRASAVGMCGAQVRAGLWIHPEHLHVHPVLRLLHQGVPLEKAKSREDCGRVRKGVGSKMRMICFCNYNTI